MKNWSLLSYLGLAITTSCVIGCSSLATFPDAATNPSQASLGSITGNNFGGHAPLVGSHVYVLQPGTTGYGSQATSLLTASNSGNGFGTTLNAGDPGIPTTWYYETTDSTGGFNISGDYTCTVNQPVYLYLYGGTPQFPSANNSFSISSINIETKTGPTRRNYTYTAQFTVDHSSSNPTENFYAGEQVVISGMPTTYGFLNGTGYVTSNANLSTTTFELSASIANGQANPAVPETYTTTTNVTTGVHAIAPVATAVATPGFNPGIVNLAVLGNCPSGSTDAGFGNTIHYVYVNEVSTVAAAFALQGFTSSANNSAIDIGSSGTAGSLLGIENAAVTAGQLYSIEGANQSTTYAGEGHIARSFTPAGNGQVPQTLLDSLGNILAACVDSRSTSTTIGNANISTECSTLFKLATDTGVPETAATAPGTPPVDTATAAINIARHPSGAGTAAQETAFMSGLYALPTGNVPFAPYLAAQPNDFVVGIVYPASLNPTIYFPEGIAIDGYGNVWFDNRTSQYIDELLPTGALGVSYLSALTPGYVAVDPSENIWWGNLEQAAGNVTVISNAGTLLSGTGYNGFYTSFNNPYAYDPAIDSTGNFYLDSYVTASNQYYLEKLTNAGVNTVNSPFTGSTTCLTGGNHPDHMAIDNATNGSNVWESDQVGGTICKFNSTTGAAVTGFPVYVNGNAGNSGGSAEQPEWIGIDASGNAWTPNRGANTMNKISPTGTVTHPTGATLSGPFSAPVDGAGNIWVTNRVSNSLTEYNGATSTAISPAGNYTAGGILNQPLNAQVDQSGNIWITNIGANPGTSTAGNSIVEIVGAGTPVVMPLSVAQGLNQLGTKP